MFSVAVCWVTPAEVISVFGSFGRTAKNTSFYFLFYFSNDNNLSSFKIICHSSKYLNVKGHQAFEHGFISRDGSTYFKVCNVVGNRNL